MNDKALLRGYICVTNIASNPIKGNYPGERFQEMIRNNTFSVALQNNKPPFMFNHNRVIASGNDIRLFEDIIGLGYEVRIDDIEVIAKALDGQLKGCSFAFKSLKDHEEYFDYSTIRVIDKMELHEVSILDKKPSYRSSVEIIDIQPILREKAEEYRKTVLNKGSISEYQKRFDELISSSGQNG